MTINEAIWRDLSPFTIGFDNMFEQLSRVRQIPQTNYPPYNIRKGKSEDTFLIELAVAGFSEDDLTISVKENNLTVVGDISRNFVLAEDVVVKGSDLLNGILTIYAERIVPEEKKARTIEIGRLPSSTKKQFLAE